MKKKIWLVIGLFLMLWGLWQSNAMAASWCGHCNKNVNWIQISDCPDCGGYRSKCPSCNTCYHTCSSSGGSSSGGETSYYPSVVSLTAVNNANSVTLKATVEDGDRYHWSVNTNDTSYSGTSISTYRQTITKTVSQAGTWYVYIGWSSSNYDYDSIKVYSVTYNANNGSNAPATQYKAHGYNLTLTNSVPTREGYTFLGWSTSSTATTATYTAGSNFTGNSNTTLYAVWERNIIPINTATVTFSETEYTYDGTEHTPSVNVVVEDKVLILGTEYTVSYTENKNAGTATVTITGVGAYTDTVTKTFEIKKKELTLDWSSKSQFIYNGTKRMPTATVESGIENESITLSIVPNPTGSIEADKYTATATIASVTNGLAENYTITNPTMNYEIIRPEYDTEAPVATVTVTPVYTDADSNRYVDKRAVTLNITASDNISETQNLKIALLNEKDRATTKNEDLVWEDFTATKSWQLSEGDGRKNVYIYVKDEAGNQSAYLD